MTNKESIGAIINKTQNRIKNNIARELKPFDVTPEQWVILNRLWNEDGISQKELAARCFKDQPTTARILDKLEKRHFIMRKSDPDDKRAFLIYLTDKGKKSQDPLTEVEKRHLERALQGLSEDETEQLKTLLKKIICNLE